MSYAEDNGLDLFDPEDMPEKAGFYFDPQEFRLVWVTKTGEKLCIEDMTTEHLRNIIKANLDGRLELDDLSANRIEIELSIRRRLVQYAEA